MTTTATPVQTDSETLVNRIIAELRADPAAQDMLLKALLTGEFLGIPVRLEGIEETLRSIQASIGAIETRLDRLEAGQQRTETRLDRLEAGQQRLEERQQLTEDRLDRLETTIDRIDNTVNRLETTVNRLDGTVGNLSGSDFETKLAKRIDPILSQNLGLNRPQIVLSPVQGLAHELVAQLQTAVAENLISEQQYIRINQTDIIIRAQRKSDRAWIWIAVEASVSIHRDDIDRALQSADALAAVFAEPSVPAAVGQRIAPPETQHAQTAGVHTTIVA